MTPPRMLLAAGFFGATAVAAGAFGAHALAERVPAADLQIWRTAASYHLLHALALLATFAAARAAPELGPALRRGALAFCVGIAIFAGTLYAMVLGGPRWLGAITPVGGASLILGWTFLGLAAWRAGQKSA